MDTEDSVHAHDPTTPWERQDIAPADVLDVLGRREPAPTWIEYWCEDIPIARVCPTGVQIACSHPSHGTHKRYANIATFMRVLSERAGLKPSICAECDGGWLAAEHPQVARQSLLARFTFLFRGIILPVSH